MSRILVVEDDAIVCEDISRTLRQLGYEVPSATASGEAALLALAAAAPPVDLVLMDIRLAGKLDGIETTQRIRERWTLPVVYLTAHSDDATLARAKETGPHGYLVKPFTERDLRTTIEVALRKHELEQRLAQRERWFASTLDATGDAVIATDSQECITFMNPAAEGLTGWREAEARGKKVSEVFKLVAADGSALEGTLGSAIRQGFRVELPQGTRMFSRHGTDRVVDDAASPVVDEQGRVIGGVAVFRDVTERKQLEHRLAISERMASVGTMAASMAHEINNPLGAALANLGFGTERFEEVRRSLGRHPAPALMLALDDTREALRDALRATERVASIVRELKRFSRVEESVRSVLDLPDILDAAIKLTEHQVRHSATLVRHYGTTPLVDANEGQLVQVFTNLIINAAQAIGEGRAESNQIELTTRTDDAGRAEVKVHDTGPGIDGPSAARIFDPFFTTKEAGVGTGLGLSISRSIVNAVGGEITVESLPGMGATFTVALPPAAAERPVARRTSQPPIAHRRGRVLAIDDDEAMNKTVRRVLRDHHEVATENTATAALARIARGERFDVIICDLVMPGMTGMDFYVSIRSVDAELASRIVFLTGGGFSEQVNDFLATCANVVLEKPFTVESLRSVVSDFVDARC